MQEEPLRVEAQTGAAPEATPQELSTFWLLVRQHLFGWSQPPQLAILQGTTLFLLTGLMALYFGGQFAQVAGPPGEQVNLPNALFIGALTLVYLGLVVLPALVALVCGLWDWRARPRLVGGRVLAVRHLPGRTSQRHYLLLETPGGKRERLRIDPFWHNQCCHPGTQVALRVTPRLRYVSKVWSEAAEPPILV